MTTDLLDKGDVEEKLAPPPKKWKPRWRMVKDSIVVCAKCGLDEIVRAGETVDACCVVHPSKDLAETRGLQLQSEFKIFLYAFPLE